MRTFIHTAVSSCITGLLLTGGLTGCDSDSNSDPAPRALHGIWERTGYGDVFVVTENGGSIYQYTRATCLRSDDADNEDIAELFQGAVVSDHSESLSLQHTDRAEFPVKFQRLNALPESCLDDRLITESTPVRSFEHFSQTYQDYYAFFNERNVDWPSRVAEARTFVHDDMSDEDLFEVFAQMLEPLDDGHVQLRSDDDLYRPFKDKGANKILEEAFAQQSDFSDIQEFANTISEKYWETIGDYLDDDSVESFDGAIDDRVIWGTMGDGTVGYLYVASMAFLSAEDGGLDEDSNLAAIRMVMDQVMEDLKDTQAMIIDVRKNIGGHDEVGLAMTSYFTDQRIRTGSKFARSYLGDTEQVDVWIEPANSTPYLKPVAVIAGVETASAAESFLLSMNALPQVTLVGENSNGILSDVLEKKLPNGWEIWLANEVYFDHLGVNYEVEGVPPEVQVPVFSLDAIEAGRNLAIDASLQVLGF